MMDTPAFDIKRPDRPALRPIVVCSLVIVAPMTAIVKRACQIFTSWDHSKRRISVFLLAFFSLSAQADGIVNVSNVEYFYTYSPAICGKSNHFKNTMAVTACAANFYSASGYFTADNYYVDDVWGYVHVTAGNLFQITLYHSYYTTCPDHSTGTPTINPNFCICDAGYVPDTTETSCVVNVKNTIALQTPLADIEPSGTTAVYANTSRTAYAKVINTQTNLPQAGVQVKFSVDVKANTGGHDHQDALRPKGKLLDCRDNTTEVESTVCITQLDGKATATFKAPIVSGTHTITATCVEPACASPASGDINVKVDGLETIPASQFYTFIGANDKHSDNHYLTPEAASVLWRLAATYYFKYRQDASVSLLHLNDASLMWGGRFDVNGNWASPHGKHRRGTVIDIRANALSTAIPESLFADFEDIAKDTKLADGVTSAIPQLHCSDGFYHANNCSGDTNRHYHVLLLGVDQ